MTKYRLFDSVSDEKYDEEGLSTTIDYNSLDYAIEFIKRKYKLPDDIIKEIIDVVENKNKEYTYYITKHNVRFYMFSLRKIEE